MSIKNFIIFACILFSIVFMSGHNLSAGDFLEQESGYEFTCVLADDPAL